MTDLPDNFANYPRSVGEARSDKSQSMRDWTPRDVLIDLLRQIDSGKLPIDMIVVSWRAPDPKAPGEYDSNFAVAGPDPNTALGMLTRTIHRMLER